MSAEPQEDSGPPESYHTNSKKEQLLLSYADNFTRQFKKLYGDRKPQFLRPLNECGVEKFVCTTLRPTCLHHKELYDWDGCASFVADYITYCPPHPPDELPKELSSPTLVLERQEGSSFDMACVLCSLLLGVGYDAYCVCGYAVREVTEMDQCGKTCPELETGEEDEELVMEEKTSRYVVRPPRDLSSQFERRQVAKAHAEEERKRKEAQDANSATEEEEQLDKYHGLRIHCWVLVLSGKREVAQSFFLEPTTGESQPVDSELYLGIESLWNHRNYWINMQDCAQGVKNMTFDLGDATKWEFFFPSVEQPLLVVPEDSSATLEGAEAKQDAKDDFELPPSWVLPIYISQKDLESRCPSGKKTILYHKSRLEKFADYLNPDGLVSRLTLYSDTARRCKVESRSSYQHREDHLQSRVEDVGTATVKECFGPGRPRSLRENIYSSVHSTNRTMLFYSNARVDGLSERRLTATEMIEHFSNREDFLYYRHTTYSKPAAGRRDSPAREIVSIVEKFHHNPALPPNNDMAQRLFQLSDPTKIRVTYHLEPNRITASYREFLTPHRGGEQAYNLTFDPQATYGYQVDQYAPEPKALHLFQQLESLMAAQEDTIAQVRASEDEVVAILERRKVEEENPELVVSVYDVARNQKAFQQREEEEQTAQEEERLQKEKERDYLSPFLARRIGHSNELDHDQMREVTEECLKDKRQSLVEKAHIIQARFDAETEALSRKQAWYKANQGSLTRDSEADYIAYCNEALFRIHILEQRLNNHKTTAPEKYLQLERQLREDPRLRDH